MLANMDDRLWRWMEKVGDRLLDAPPRTDHYEKNLESYLCHSRRT